MADVPTLTDYVNLIISLFGLFKQYRSEQQGAKRGRPFTYPEEMFIVFFMLMQYRQIHTFKGQWRWLQKHPDMLTMLGWATVPLGGFFEGEVARALALPAGDAVLYLGLCGRR